MANHETKLKACYGKDKIRVLRVVRQGAWHQVVEYNVTALLEGDIDVSYTEADNSVIVTTDSIKNITYYLSKISPHILHPERFALHLGTHLVSKYAHIHKAFITIEQLRWSRLPADTPEVGEKGHPHSFVRDGDDKRIVHAEVDASAGKNRLIGRVSAGLSDLLVLKSSGSSFSDFIRDEYTTLVEVDDRVLSTSVELDYVFAPVNIVSPTDEKKLDFALESQQGGVWDADVIAGTARKITLETFATDDSASVQATLYKMAKLVLSAHADVKEVTYKLPNKHYIPVDMRYLGVENLHPPSSAEVFMPIDAPSGLITATVSKI